MSVMMFGWLEGWKLFVRELLLDNEKTFVKRLRFRARRSDGVGGACGTL